MPPLQPNLPSLFKPPIGREARAGASPDAIARAQSALGVQLPALLIKLWKARNGGRLRAAHFTLLKRPPRRLWSGRYHFQSLPSAGANDDIVDLTATARDWEIPDGLIPLFGDGHWWCCLDYRNRGSKREPSITHIDTDAIGEFEVAPTFADFLTGLYRSPEDREPALIALDDGAPRGDALAAVLEPLGCTRYLFPGCVTNPNFPHPPTWNWKKYRSFVRGLCASIAAENNRLYSVSILKTAERPADHPMLTVSVTPAHAKKCLNELLAALGPAAALMHSVE